MKKKSKVSPSDYGPAAVRPAGSIAYMYLKSIDFGRPIPATEGVYCPAVVAIQEPYVYELDNLARKGEVTVFVRLEPNKTMAQIEQDAQEQAVAFLGELSQMELPPLKTEPPTT